MIKRWLQRVFGLRMIVYRRVKKIEWTKADADWLRDVTKSDVWKKFEAFQHDAIANGVLNGENIEFLNGWRFALAEIERFKGKDEKPEEEPEDFRE